VGAGTADDVEAVLAGDSVQLLTVLVGGFALMQRHNDSAEGANTHG
jgi:hypothetical protein